MGNFDQEIAKIQAIVGASHVLSDDKTLTQYSVDGVTARVVAFPNNTRQVSDVVRIASQAEMAITVWGGGTKIGTGNAPQRLDLVICTRRMNHVIDVDASNLSITVEAGVKFSEIQARLATEEDRCYLPLTEDTAEFVCSDREHSGCFLPLDPPFSDETTIGGTLAANVTGPRRLLYGLPRDLVLGLRFVSPGGDVIGTGGKTVKNVSGYDIAKLLIGSYGTLGVLCEATLRLLPMPEKMQTLIFAFDSLDDAARLADKIHGTQLLPAAVEVFNDRALDAVWPEGIPAADTGTHLVAAALEGFAEPVDRMRNEIQVMAGQCRAVGTDLLKESRHREFWRRVSHLGSYLGRQWPHMVSAKLNFPMSQWHGMASAAQSRLTEGDIDHVVWAHSGSGVCHLSCSAASGEQVIEALNGLLVKCQEAGGNMTILQAPDGLKPQLPIWGNAGQDRAIMARIKHQIDPAHMMNPGRFMV